MKTNKDCPNLRRLMANFHQDWKDTSASSEEVLRQFVETNPPELVAASSAEIRRLLASGLDSQSVDNIMLRDWHVEPPYDKPTHARRWLEEALGILARASSKTVKRNRKETVAASPHVRHYPGLYLLMCQFDDAWKSVFGTEAAVLSHFRKTASTKDIEACVSDVQRVLKEPFEDEQLDSMLRKDFGALPPYSNSEEVRPWLSRAVKLLKPEARISSRPHK